MAGQLQWYETIVTDCMIIGQQGSIKATMENQRGRVKQLSQKESPKDTNAWEGPPKESVFVLSSLRIFHFSSYDHNLKA